MCFFICQPFTNLYAALSDPLSRHNSALSTITIKNCPFPPPFLCMIFHGPLGFLITSQILQAISVVEPWMLFLFFLLMLLHQSTSLQPSNNLSTMRLF